jgi:hypothetical protein
MSAATAAKALMNYDADLAASVRNFPADRNERSLAAAVLVRETAGAWTLALAAAAAGVGESMVLAALVQNHIRPCTAPAARAFVSAALAKQI